MVSEAAARPVPVVDDVDVVFGGGAMKILPPYDQIPAEFKDWNRPNRWAELVNDWFFWGLKDCKWTPKPGVDTEAALRAARCCMASFEPQHEHKTAGVALLLSEWFDDATYERYRDLPDRPAKVSK